MKNALAVFALFLAAFAWSLAGAPQGDAPPGKDLFEQRCGGCHSLDRDKEGPRLRGAYGRAAASVESFAYSEALKKSGLTWDAGTLDRWLTDSEKLVPNTDMTFRVPSAAERGAIIEYLRQNSRK